MAQALRIRSIKHNFFLNTTRTVFNFLVPLVIFPYVSRVLGPDGLGKVEFANSIVSYFVLFTALGIPTYGMREIARVRDDEYERSRTVWELTIILLALVGLGYTVYVLLVRLIPQFYAQRVLFFIVAPSIFLSDFSYEWFYQGIENQTYITVRYIAVKIMQVLLIFLLVKQAAHFLRYAAILVGMNSISTLFNIAHLRHFVRFVPLRELHGIRHLPSIAIVFASIVAVNIYMHLDVTMVGFFCGANEVGLYTAANRLIRIIISLVTALSAVIVPRLENCLKNGDIQTYQHYLNLSLHYILIFAVPCCLGIIVLAPDVITLFAGEKYADSVTTIRLLSPIIIIVGLAYVVGLQILYPYRAEWKYTVSVSVAAAVNAACNAILIPRMAQNGAALGTVVAELLGLLLQCVFARHYLAQTDLFSLNTAKYLAAGLVMFLAVRFLPYVAGSVAIHLVLCVLLAVFVYGGGLLLMRERLVTETVRSMVRRKRMRRGRLGKYEGIK